MASIKFLIKTNSETSTIYLRFKQNPVDLTAKTNFIINSKDWSNKKGKPLNPKSVELKQLDKDLKQLGLDLLDYYNKSVSKQTLNLQWLKDFINPPVENGTIPTKLSAYIDYYTLHKKNAIGSSTYKRNNVYKHLIERFEIETKREYFIKDINADFKLAFETYCIKKKYSHNTIARTIKFLKTIGYHARGNGVDTHFQLDNISVRLKKVDKVFLSIAEIQLIQIAKLELDYLVNARDWLIISCETGQRVSDFMRFTKEQIRYESEVPLIEFTQIKTGKIMSIPLSKKVVSILKKRKGNFPRQISDQKYNEYIKEVCKIAGIKQIIKGSKSQTVNKITRKETGQFPKHELITSHVGRRSFATNNYGRIPTSLLINVTGHSTETMFLEYIGKTVTEKALLLAEYFKDQD